MSDVITFLKAFLRQPSRVGAITPSSPALAACMVRAADLHEGQVVVEIGAGTGPMTRALCDARPGAPLLALEPDAQLAKRARENAPEAEVVEAFAQELPALIAARGWSQVDRVVSSLPFASFPSPLQHAVLGSVCGVLAPEGRMVTFTYIQSPYTPAGYRARRLFEAYFERVSTTPVVWRNTPPAFVYICEHARKEPVP